MLLKNFTLLYVEDDRQTQEQVKMMLEDSVKKLFQAYNGEEGLSLYEQEHPDIIMTDIAMPKLDGLAMSKAIKQKNKSQSIVVISAFDNKEILLEAINTGIDYFIPKPIDMDTVFEKLNLIALHLQNYIEVQNAKKQELKKLKTLAHYDALTHIFNRHTFNIKLDEALHKAKQENINFALVLIDLNKFKEINDTYGHVAGDRVLYAVAQNIKKVIRKEDVLARIGGDEFAVIIKDIDDKLFVNTLAEKIIQAVANPINFASQKLHVTCSLGISYCTQETSSTELLQLTDIAMYKAKRQNQTFS